MSSQAKVHAQVEAILEEAYMNMPEGVLVPCIKIVYFQHSHTAGRARGSKTIEINTDLAEKYPENLRDTVLHELAHCMTALKYQRRVKPHGPEWQDIACLLGANPKACHDMDQPDIKRRRHGRHTYHCGCTEHHLTTGKHNKIQIYGMTRKCLGCGEQLNYGPMEYNQ